MKYSQLQVTSMVADDSVSFDAYFTDMTQTFSSTWNSEDVYGRNDPIVLFQGTKRTISISLDVPSRDKEQAAANLSKCGKLASFLYPGYETDFSLDENPNARYFEEVDDNEAVAVYNKNNTPKATMVTPPLVKVKFANLIDSMLDTGGKKGLLGFIDSYTFTPVLEAGMFGSGPLYPRTISISFNLNVLHQSPVGFMSDEQEIEGDALITKWMSRKLPFS